MPARIYPWKGCKSPHWHRLACDRKFLSALPGRSLKFACRGNTDIASGLSPAALREEFGRFGVEMLINSRVSAQLGEARIGVLGFDNTSDGRADFSLIPQLSPDDFNLVLMHSPEAFPVPALRQSPVDLVLAGHTHGGQILIPGIPPYWVYPDIRRYLSGFYRRPGLTMYVTRGIGMPCSSVGYSMASETLSCTRRICW